MAEKSMPPPDAPPAVLYERVPPWARLRLNRPQVHNAFDVTMRDGLFELLGAAAADLELAGVVILGEGPSFGTGGDLREFSLAPEPWRNKLVRRERDVWRRLLRFPGLTVAVVHGNVAGSGLELALACDLRLAAPDSRWLLPETGTGMIPGAGGTQLLPRLARPGRALDVMLRGRVLSGEDAHRLGLAAGLVPAEGRAAAAAGWLDERLGALPAAGLALWPRLKTLVRDGLDMPLAAGLDMERLAAGA